MSDQTADMTLLATPITESNKQKTSTEDDSLSEREMFEKTLGKERVTEAMEPARAKENDKSKKTAGKEMLPDWFK
ncbi:hypothetical protein [Domibacillus mangrovi]|uniref:Uncharacterized protein n=1 Tax=Domibacillus mangrovi TaxID=1714354 RepID=A0A1Q5P0K7_9BACI|nr:hypothetical protein [Domibacillus mangrovi]OKL35632.1 hypothetical protein BLL40_14680 [Domibacillus mangrovi]